MNDLLRPYLKRFVLVYFYVILVYSSTFQDHLTHLELIMDLLETKQFFAKLSKCSFTTTQVSYLGHVISSTRVVPNLDKVKVIIDWPQPRSLTYLRRFLSLNDFY